MTAGTFLQEHRASTSGALHSNGSLTLYRNYQRAVLAPGVPLLLASAGHEYIGGHSRHSSFGEAL
jgi:hypothetical protein